MFRLDGTNVDQVPGIFEQFGAHNHARLEDAVAEAVRLAAHEHPARPQQSRIDPGRDGPDGHVLRRGRAQIRHACVVAGVSPGREGTTVGEDVPVFASVRAAREATGADTAIVFVPPAAVLGATIEAIEAGCRLVVATADELPVLDTIEIRAAARANGTAFVGPNSPGPHLAGQSQARLHAFVLLQGRQRRRDLAQRLAVV